MCLVTVFPFAENNMNTTIRESIFVGMGKGGGGVGVITMSNDSCSRNISSFLGKLP